MSNDPGYRKPPRHSQWKKGQSGNPKGRPRSSLNVSELFTQMLRQKAVVKHGKTTRRITRLEQILEAMMENAAAGATPQVKMVLEHAHNHDALAAKEAREAAPQPPGPADRKVLDVLYARLTKDALAKHAAEEKKRAIESGKECAKDEPA